MLRRRLGLKYNIQDVIDSLIEKLQELKSTPNTTQLITLLNQIEEASKSEGYFSRSDENIAQKFRRELISFSTNNVDEVRRKVILLLVDIDEFSEIRSVDLEVIVNLDIKTDTGILFLDKIIQRLPIDTIGYKRLYGIIKKTENANLKLSLSEKTANFIIGKFERDNRIPLEYEASLNSLIELLKKTGSSLADKLKKIEGFLPFLSTNIVATISEVEIQSLIFNKPY